MRVKNVIKRRFTVFPTVQAEPVAEAVTETPKKNNKKDKKEEAMTTEQIERAEALAMDVNAPSGVKVIKKDKGLIERTESSKIVLTEDNRQVLND